MTHASLYPVSDLVWNGESFAQSIDLAREQDIASALRGLKGHFALHQELPSGEHILARDPLGVNKLFFAFEIDGSVISSNFLLDLLCRGIPTASIYSVPSGHYVVVNPRSRELRLERYVQLGFGEDREVSLPELGASIRKALEETFAALGKSLDGRPTYVTLSGGLDSTLIAALAKRYVPGLRAVTFKLAGEDTEDVLFARRVAESLDIPLEVVTFDASEIELLLDTVLVYGQDWRDFNVHCGLVNAAIGSTLGERHADGARPVVLTGDTMNELMADYLPVTYRGRVYYELPRMSAERLRRFLVAGLDSGDREVGIFARFGVDTVQPYALCASAYAGIPGALLESEDAKASLARAVAADLIPAFVFDRPKVRAQVGSSESVGGTLAALVDRGIDAHELEQRFSSLFGLDPKELSRLIRAGFYRFTSTYPR